MGLGVAAVLSVSNEGNGLALAYVVVALVLLAVLGPLAFFIGRDANRRGRNGWAWGLLFLWQPVIVGIAYLIMRSRTPNWVHELTRSARHDTDDDKKDTYSDTCSTGVNTVSHVS